MPTNSRSDGRPYNVDKRIMAVVVQMRPARLVHLSSTRTACYHHPIEQKVTANTSAIPLRHVHAIQCQADYECVRYARHSFWLMEARRKAAYYEKWFRLDLSCLSQALMLCNAVLSFASERDGQCGRIVATSTG